MYFARVDLDGVSGVLYLEVSLTLTYSQILTMVGLRSLAGYARLTVTRDARRLTLDLSLSTSLALLNFFSIVFRSPGAAQVCLTASEMRFLASRSPSTSVSLFGIAAMIGFGEYKEESTYVFLFRR